MSDSHPLQSLYRKRVQQSRDLVVLITDSSNDRGTGKTTLALKLARDMDRTDAGVTTEKVALDPRPMSTAYTREPEGSAIVLDETEVGLDKYSASSGVNKAIRELVSMGRVEQKYLILNAPADHLVDSDLKTLVDVWVSVDRRGYADAYRMDWNPHEGHALTRKLGGVSWDAIDDDQLQEVYEHLTTQKRQRLAGEDGGQYVTESEHREAVEAAREEASLEARDEWISALYEHTELSQTDIANLPNVSVSRQRISQLAGK